MQDKLNTNQNLQEDEKQVLLDNKGRSYATGKRKNSTARVWLKKGEGKIIVNGKTSYNYFTLLIGIPISLFKYVKLMCTSNNWSIEIFIKK